MPPDTLSTPPLKVALRRELRQARAAVTAVMQARAARSVMRHAVSGHLCARGRRVAFYMPAKGELDILPLLNRALHMGVACYLPVVPGRRRRRLWFARLGGGRHWSRNRYGILEYGADLAKVRARVLDVVFLPLLGFDARGYRMGMGGGYYDSSLAYLRHRRVWCRPRLIGVGYETQYRARLPEDPWDVQLDAVVTEAGVRRFRRVPAQ